MINLASSPGPLKREEKGPGIHCLRMLRSPKNLRGSDTIAYLSAHKSAYVLVSCPDPTSKEEKGLVNLGVGAKHGLWTLDWTVD